jgi:serine protease Do
LIADTLRGSSAEAAGIRQGDIIIAADGVPIRSAAQLRNKIGLARIGERVHLTLDRNGALHKVVVEISAGRGTRASSSLRK